MLKINNNNNQQKSLSISIYLSLFYTHIHTHSVYHSLSPSLSPLSLSLTHSLCLSRSFIYIFPIYSFMYFFVLSGKKLYIKYKNQTKYQTKKGFAYSYPPHHSKNTKENSSPALALNQSIPQSQSEQPPQQQAHKPHNKHHFPSFKTS